MALLSISELPATFGSRKGVPPGPGPVGPTRQGPCLAQPRQMRRLKMMKYHFFRRLRPHSRAGCCTCKKAGSKRTPFATQNQSSLEWGGESPPTGCKFPAWGGGQPGRTLLCVSVSDGAHPKKSRFLENCAFVFVVPTT